MSVWPIVCVCICAHRILVCSGLTRMLALSVRSSFKDSSLMMKVVTDPTRDVATATSKPVRLIWGEEACEGYGEEHDKPTVNSGGRQRDYL